MNYFLIVAISFALLLLLWIAMRRSPAAVHDHSTDASDYSVRLPPRALLDRLLSPEDVEYASTVNSPLVLGLVVRERRRLAAAWLRQTRREAARLFRLHVRTARQAEGLRPVAELKLIVAACSFLAVYAVMMAVVSFYGPLRTRRFLETLQTLATVLSNLGGRIAESISPDIGRQLDARTGH